MAMKSNELSDTVRVQDLERCPLCGNAIVKSQVRKTRVTERQMRTLQVIATHIHSFRSSPTIREVANGLNIQPTAAQHHMDALRKKGLLTWIPKQMRSCTITQLGYEILQQAAKGKWKVGRAERGYRKNALEEVQKHG